MLNTLESIEINVFLESIFLYYGFDLRGYEPEYLTKRLFSYMEKEGLMTISSLQEKVLHQKDCFYRFVDFVTYGGSDMFNDASFFKALREKVFPILKDLDFIRIWVAGCSTGEEVFSLAIMLREADLLGKCNIYATDINETSLEKAKTKKIPVAQMGIGSHNYLAGGGNHNFSQYFTFVNGDVLISEEIGRNMIWSRHNLISDASFNEFNVILCRYVLPNFSNKNWVAHAHKVLFESLTDSGILALGTTESINKTPYELNYTILDEENKIYLKTGY